MKQMKAWMLAAILICGTAAMFTSCKANEDSPVIVVNCPTITIQPENVMYTLGDAEYPKLNVVAIASAGELTYEWFVKNEEGNYYSSGITTAELDLHAFIDNMIVMLREEAVGDYTFMCKVTDGNGIVESNEATLTIAANPPTPPRSR